MCGFFVALCILTFQHPSNMPLGRSTINSKPFHPFLNTGGRVWARNRLGWITGGMLCLAFAIFPLGIFWIQAAFSKGVVLGLAWGASWSGLASSCFIPSTFPPPPRHKAKISVYIRKKRYSTYIEKQINQQYYTSLCHRLKVTDCTYPLETDWNICTG